jgi:hypothetical protein
LFDVFRTPEVQVAARSSSKYVSDLGKRSAGHNAYPLLRPLMSKTAENLPDPPIVFCAGASRTPSEASERAHLMLQTSIRG